MKNTLFLYLDILGFKDLVTGNADVLSLYRIINDAQLHSDVNFRSIVFSDTIVVYNLYGEMTREAKEVEVMFLIELAQDLFLRLIGTGVFFRAVITEGEFHHERMDHLDAYFGKALVESHTAEKELSGSGLFLHRNLRPLNQIFRFKPFSETHDFIFLTHFCTGLTPGEERNVDERGKPDYSRFPIPAEIITSGATESLIYPEIVHFHEVYRNMNEHPSPRVREIFLTTWNMYCLAYPGLIRSLLDHEFNPDAVASLDWSEAKARFERKKGKALTPTQ